MLSTGRLAQQGLFCQNFSVEARSPLYITYPLRLGPALHKKNMSEKTHTGGRIHYPVGNVVGFGQRARAFGKM